VDEEFPRYYFLGGGARTADARQMRALLIVGLSVGIAVVWRDTYVLVISAVFAVGGLLMLLRSGRPGLYVELQEHHVVVKLLVSTRIPYDKIVSVEHPIQKHGTLVRGAINLAVAVNRITGGDVPWAPSKDQADLNSVQISSRETIWMPYILPPLYFPRKTCQFMVEDAGSLKAEIEARVLMTG
jgi:hypothetical protein